MENRRFHELLEAHLRTSGYTNYEFARITGINRVNIQRYLAGTRLPDPQIFEAIRRELRLGVREHRELQEAYYRAMDGDDVYFMRCMIRRMLEKVGNICGMEAGEQKPAVLEENTKEDLLCRGKGIQIIDGAIAAERYLWNAIRQNLESGAGEAYFYIPAEKFVLARFLPAYELEGRSAMEHLKIIQLVRLTKRAEDMGHGYHNLKTIGNLIPTYYQAGQAYETRYFYSDFPEEDDSGSLYPYYGILGDRMIFFTSAMDQAVVLFGKAVVEPFYRRFSGKLRHMDVLVIFFRDVVQMLQWTLENDNGPVRRCFLEYQPCFAIWTDEELTEHVVVPDLPGRSQVIAGLMARKGQLDAGEELIHYFTEDGVREFAETGRCADYPAETVRALTAEERIRILERMLEDLKRETRDLGIVKEQNFHLTKMLNIFVSSAMGAGMVLYDEKRGFRQIMIREPSVFRAFDTFIRSMREHGEVYSREETAAIIRKYIDWLKQGGTVAGTS